MHNPTRSADHGIMLTICWWTQKFSQFLAKWTDKELDPLTLSSESPSLPRDRRLMATCSSSAGSLKNEIRHLALQAASPRAKSQAIIDETSPKSLAPILRTKASKGLRRPGNSLINGRNYLLMSATCELLNINESMRYIWKRKIKKLPSFILV